MARSACLSVRCHEFIEVGVAIVWLLERHLLNISFPPILHGVMTKAVA